MLVCYRVTIKYFAIDNQTMLKRISQNHGNLVFLYNHVYDQTESYFVDRASYRASFNYILSYKQGTLKVQVGSMVVFNTF
jgi:hypothetical protein